jgi:hypothetical protein
MTVLFWTFDWYISKDNTTDIKLKIIYRSMERSRTYKLLSGWLERFFLDTGITILDRLLGWTAKMTTRTRAISSYKWYIDAMEGCNCAYRWSREPSWIAKDLKAYAEENGEIVRER